TAGLARCGWRTLPRCARPAAAARRRRRQAAGDLARDRRRRRLRLRQVGSGGPPVHAVRGRAPGRTAGDLPFGRWRPALAAHRRQRPPVRPHHPSHWRPARIWSRVSGHQRARHRLWRSRGIHSMKMLSLSAALALASLLPGVAQATLDLPLLYSRGAALQRERPIHVWGWDTPGTKVRLDFDGKQANAVTDAQGRWQATLPAHAAGGPYVLEVDDGHEQRRIGDVLVGDVWLCSGQSNMEFMVSQGRDAEPEQARGDDPSIRQFKIPHSSAIRPQRQLQGGNWVAANPSTVGQFSAVCWFFARDMQARTHVPQGLINSSWGGSAIEAWTDAQTGHFDVAAVAAKKQADDAADAVGNARTYKRIARWPALHADVNAADGSLAWAAEKLDVSDWDSLPVPSDWEPVGYYDMDGVAWYRRQFTLSAAEAAQGVTLGLGRIDDSDQSFVNGHP